MFKLTLKSKVELFDAWEVNNKTFSSLTNCEKLTNFQSMWKTDSSSINLYACLHDHLRRNSQECDHFCSSLGSPYCGHLNYFLSTNDWPD